MSPMLQASIRYVDCMTVCLFSSITYNSPSPGDTAMSRMKDLELSSPVVKGRIVHWDNMERIWHHCFYRELKVAPEDRAVVLALSTETPMSEK